MAYNGKVIGIQRVIEKAFRNAGLEKIDWEAAIEWTGELMGNLGVPYTYIDMTTNGLDDMPDPIEVVDYRATLPTDLVTLKSIRKVELDDDGFPETYAPMVESQDVFHLTQIDQEENTTTYYDPIVLVTEVNTDEDGYPEADYVYYESDVSYSEDPIESYTYKVQGGVIFTNFQEGYVEVSYKGYPIDSDGYPLIPEDPKFVKALEYYIISMIDWKRWRANPQNPGLKAIANDSEQRYLWAAGAARNKAHIPTYDRMESLKRMWLRSIDRVNEHATGWRTTTEGEQRYN